LILFRESGTLEICQWTAIGILSTLLDYEIKFNHNCPTYSKKPFFQTEQIMTQKLERVLNDLKHYIQISYCDSIEPNYRIPILDHSKSYSSSGFFPLKFKDANISSDDGLYTIINYLLKKRTSDQYQILLVDVGIFWRYYKWIYNPRIRIP